MVGYDKSDDASVYVLSEDLALIQTTDFFPPIVDDPYLYGKIAATNALSDVYAMGGEPKLALIRDGYPVTRGFKIADIDPRASEYQNCFTISDKARCIAGGVVEAVLHLKKERGL